MWQASGHLSHPIYRNDLSCNNTDVFHRTPYCLFLYDPFWLLPCPSLELGQPPTELPLPPSLDYIHLISCKILWGCFTTIGLCVSPLIVSLFATFDPMRSFLRIIRRSVLVCVGSMSRFLNAISLAITAWGSVLNLFRPLGQAASSALVRVGFIPLYRTAAKSLSKTTFVQRIFRFCEWTFVTLCIA